MLSRSPFGKAPRERERKQVLEAPGCVTLLPGVSRAGALEAEKGSDEPFACTHPSLSIGGGEGVGWEVVGGSEMRGAVLNSPALPEDSCWECSRILWEGELCSSSISTLYSPC